MGKVVVGKGIAQPPPGDVGDSFTYSPTWSHMGTSPVGKSLLIVGVASPARRRIEPPLAHSRDLLWDVPLATQRTVLCMPSRRTRRAPISDGYRFLLFGGVRDSKLS